MPREGSKKDLVREVIIYLSLLTYYRASLLKARELSACGLGMYRAKQVDFHLPIFSRAWSGTPFCEAADATPMRKNFQKIGRGQGLSCAKES